MRCRHNAEVFGVKVRRDDESVTPVVDGVFNVVGSGANALRFGEGSRCIEKVNFATRLRARVNDDESTAACEFDADEKSFVVIGENDLVIGEGRSDFVAAHLKGSFGVVGNDVEKVL